MKSLTMRINAISWFSELYALHKQAAAGDCEVDKPTNKGAAEKAKWQAWKTKAGLSQAEAMSRYITECDRQIRVYGSKVRLNRYGRGEMRSEVKRRVETC